jgi:hypothetical protein
MAPNVAAKYLSGQPVLLVLDALTTTSTRSPVLNGRWSRCSFPPLSIGRFRSIRLHNDIIRHGHDPVPTSRQVDLNPVLSTD